MSKYKFDFVDNEKVTISECFKPIEIRTKSYDPVASFYSELSISNWKKFLTDSLTSLDGAYEPNGIRWERGPVNEEGFLIKTDEICFIGFSGEKHIKKEEFHSLNLEFAHKCLESVTWFGLLEKEMVTQELIESIRNWIVDVETTGPS